ncbi:hypothetical protein CDAR_267401 [Caerostris darwini]|uniref:Uncharacterized protein n=1 Tax=Caerostris darwini TaxID=1538125 RepID=A0AAV4TFV3_9ARAC|nr:hypothetical protein CDAR_267401 [Caerostris darwini]
MKFVALDYIDTRSDKKKTRKKGDYGTSLLSSVCIMLDLELYSYTVTTSVAVGEQLNAVVFFVSPENVRFQKCHLVSWESDEVDLRSFRQMMLEVWVFAVNSRLRLS